MTTLRILFGDNFQCNCPVLANQRQLRCAGRGLEVLTSITRNQSSGIQLRVSAEAVPDVEVVHDEVGQP